MNILKVEESNQIKRSALRQVDKGKMMRDFAYVDDIVEAISRLVKK
ncbi:hypothetical protein [Tetragenococcus halophilus]|nr:hypothetical protein [Tetragenococcus halophilus]